MNTLRKISQIVFLAGFVYLFLATTRVLSAHIPTHIYFQLDPLVAVVAWISTRSFYAPLALAFVSIGLTLLLGRVFCGWFCPLGTVIDLSDRFVLGLRDRLPKRRKTAESERRRWPLDRIASLKYVVLIAVVVCAALGTQISYFLDPFAILYRSLTMVFYAPLQYVLRAIAARAPGIAISGFVDVGDLQVFYQGHVIVLIVFVGILSLGLLGRRFWCRNLCPLGGLLGLLSIYPVLRRKVTDACTSCTRCASLCKMAAIGTDYKETLITECIQCYACVPICPPKATSIPIQIAKSNVYYEPDITRRRLLQGAGLGAAWLVVARGGGSAKHSVRGLPISSDVLIRPPGAIREDLFNEACTRCAECIKVCPTNAIHSAIGEAGIDGFMSPVIIPRIGYCAQPCNWCGQVCPTGAILPFEMIEKKWLFIGRAVIDRSACIAWYKDAECTVCDEHCSYDAIYQKVVDGDDKPFVNDEMCIGCGECERVCPVQPVAAIRVFGVGDRRDETRQLQLEYRRLAVLQADQLADPDVDAAAYQQVSGREVFIKPPEPKY
jgi:polyferredoxin